MKQEKFTTAYVISGIIAVLAATASAGGLFINGLYRNRRTISLALQGNDFVTLFVAVPLLIGAMIFSRRGSRRAFLIWMGMLLYMLYNYIFYQYGAAFNQFFLLYVALFTLSIFSLIFSLPRIDAGEISTSFSPRTPVRWIAAYMLFFGGLLGLLWIMKSLEFITTGEVPQDIVKTDHPTAVVYATDLSILIPGLFLGAILLWRKHPWGYIVSTIMMIKAPAYALVLLVMSGYLYLETGAGDPYTGLWAFLAAGCLLCLGVLLACMNSGSRSTVRAWCVRFRL